LETDRLVYRRRCAENFGLEGCWPLLRPRRGVGAVLLASGGTRISSTSGKTMSRAAKIHRIHRRPDPNLKLFDQIAERAPKGEGSCRSIRRAASTSAAKSIYDGLSKAGGRSRRFLAVGDRTASEPPPPYMAAIGNDRIVGGVRTPSSARSACWFRFQRLQLLETVRR